MAGPSYATDADVYRAVPPGSLSMPARAVASVDAVLNRIEVNGHACALDTPVQLSVDEDGVLPAPLSAAAVYYARPVDGSDSLLELAATVGGAAIDLTAVGSGSIRFIVPIGGMLAMLRDAHSRDFDAMCIAHVVPFASPYPALAVHYVAVMTAWAAAIALGKGTQADRLTELKDEVAKKAVRWGQGVPLRDADATGPSNLARGRTPTTRDRDVIP